MVFGCLLVSHSSHLKTKSTNLLPLGSNLYEPPHMETCSQWRQRLLDTRQVKLNNYCAYFTWA